MLVYYKEKKYIIISFIIILLDGLLVYYIPSYFHKLSLFYPMLTISLLPFLYHGNLKNYYKLCFLIGIIYDLLYSNIFLYNAFLFLIMGKIDSKILKFYQDSFFIYFFLVFINICFYDTITFLLVLITSYQSVTFNDLIYKIKNSLLLNILSVFVYYFLCRKKDSLHTM